MRRGASAFLVLAMLALTTRGALAKDPTKAEVQIANDMVKEAINEVIEGHCDDAIQMLKQAIAIHETGEAFLYIGECEATQGRLIAAVAAWKHGEEVAQKQKDKSHREAIEKKRKAAEARIPTLRLELPDGVNDAEVSLDGEPVAADALAEPMQVDPGTHQIEAKAPGRKAFSKKLEVEEEAKISVSIELPEEVKSKPVVVRSSGVPLGTWIAAGASVALVGGGVFAFLSAGAQAQAGEEDCRARVQCNADMVGAVRTLDGVALGAFIGAGVAAGAAVGIWALSSKKGPADEKTARIVVGPGSVSILGRF